MHHIFWTELGNSGHSVVSASCRESSVWECMATACLGLSVLKTGEGIVFPSHTMVGFFLICLMIMVFIFCAELWELFHLTCDLSQAEKKIVTS